jgi:hypothetical protein
MRTIARKTVNGIDISSYQRHPRVLELKVIFMYQLLVNEYNDVWAQTFFRQWADLNRMNWSLLSGFLNQKQKIRKLETLDRGRFRQEVIFMGLLFNEVRREVAERYLGISKTYIYRKENNFDVEEYVTEDWLLKLDETVVLCGIPQYRNEVERFVETLENFLEVIGHVSVAKSRV